MKRRISLLLCAAMLMGTLAGCGQSTNQDSQPATDDSQQTEVNEETADIVKELLEGKDALQASFSAGDVMDAVPSNSGVYASKSGGASVGEQFTIEGADYVLIYNPYIYDELAQQSSNNLYSGDFSTEIALGNNRAGFDDLDLEVTLSTPAQPSSVDLDVQKGGRAAGWVETFEVGEKSDFYYASSYSKNIREKAAFTCEYVGKNCYIWSLNGAVSAKDAKAFGDEFDKNIYVKDTKAFGQARFTDDGGKVNLLFYPMDMEGLGGFFYLFDIFASDEVYPSEVEQYGMNLDRAVININTNAITSMGEKSVKSIMAHEFQHLICASNSLENSGNGLVFMSTWLNESMSAYAEELNYPGIKKENNYNLYMYPSENFRKGQSLYNFSIENDEYIGAYGAVYLFEEFIRKYEGDEVLTKVHDFWRTESIDQLVVSEALYNSVSSSFIKEVDESIEYPAEISKNFGSEADEWMSKLALNFHLETLSQELADLEAYDRDFRDFMIYDEKSATDIEGGGRIIVATQGGSYTVPADASADLVYIGLDKDYNVVTDVITAYTASSAGSNGSQDAETSINYDKEGYYEFKYNNKAQAYVLSDGSISDKAIDAMLDSGVCQLKGVKASKVKKSNMAGINTELKSILDKDTQVGFVTVLVPDKITDSEWVDFATVCDGLVSKGVYVSIVSNEYPAAYPYPWCFVLSAEKKGVKNVVESMPEAIGEAILNTLSECYDGSEKCPLIFTAN